VNQLLNIIKLTRPLNCLIASAAVWTGAYLTLAPVDFWPVMIASVCVFLIGAAGNIHNDICDIEVDRVAHPDRALASGKVAVSFARKLAVVLSVVAIGMSVFLGLRLWLVIAGVLAMLFVYNRRLKWVPLLGNLVVAAVAATTFIVGGVASEPLEVFDLPGPLIPALFGFLIHLMRELTKDLVDMEGDCIAGRKTLPILIGVRPVLMLVVVVGLALVWCLYQPYAREWYGVRYWTLSWAGVLPLTLGMAVVALVRPKPAVIAALAVSLKLSMLVGLIALYLA
jgi:4-hydroxybenzoate polyprenyltransferase